jgi:hypothetical protein
VNPRKLLKDLEAAIGIEPMNKGFAVSEDLLLRVWVDAFYMRLIGICDISSAGMFTQIRVCFAW